MIIQILLKFGVTGVYIQLSDHFDFQSYWLVTKRTLFKVINGLFHVPDKELYRVSQEEWTKLRESVPYVELYQYNPKHLYPKLNGYRDNGQRSLKLWQLLHTCWLPNTY